MPVKKWLIFIGVKYYNNERLRRKTSMPIYEFKCLKCDQQFEKFVFSSNYSEVACPFCGSKEVEKEYSTFSSCGSDSGSPSTGGYSGGHSGMG